MIGQFEIKQNHPFLEFSSSLDGPDFAMDIQLREFVIDKVLWSDWLGFSLGSYYLIDNPTVHKTDLRTNQLIDHFVGTALSKFIYKVRCAKHIGVLNDINLFAGSEGKAPRLNTRAMNVFFTTLLYGLPFLTGESKSQQNKYILQVDSQGQWMTTDGTALPPLRPAAWVFETDTMNKEAEILGVQANMDMEQANLAMKAKLLMGFTRIIYNLEFSQEVPEKLLQSPYRRYQLEEQPQDVGDRLKKILEKKTSGKTLAAGG